MPDQGWQAAACTVRLPTPTNGRLAGYAARVGQAGGTADQLEANLLLIKDSRAQLLWISIDTVAIRSEFRAAIVVAVTAAAGIAAEQIVCVASHTHSAPAGWVGSIHPGLPAELDESAIRSAADAIATAAAGLHPRPTTIAWAEGSVEGVGSNRHDPSGPTDQSIGILLVGPVDDPVALVYDYGCHPTVLGPDNLSWSADWVGAARGHLRRELAADLPILFLQGCAGDQSTRFLRRRQSIDEVARLGGLVGAAVLAALPGIPIRGGGLGVAHRQLRLATRRPADSRTDRSRTVSGPDRLEASRREGRHAQRAMINSGLPAEMILPLTLVSIGVRSWLHCSVEPYSLIGRQLREVVAGLRLIGYSDDYHGYLCDPSAADSNQYEAMSSYFDRDGSEEFCQACLDFARAH
ncbi:MAG TPA: hypothetical protein VIP98_24485 [Microlunatus sp.]